jgi:hypothetical protein
MRRPMLAVLVAAALCASCGQATPAFDPSPHELWKDCETGMAFAVIPVDQHPFLVDHDRQLVIVPPRSPVNRVALYLESGFGEETKSANLYKDDKGRFIVIDINGIWLTIDPESGQVLSCEWRWEEPTPKRYLGTFVTGNPIVYRFIAAAQRPESSPYGIKDPSHPLLPENP